MKLAFTLCSNNFLSYALTMANSLIEMNPHYRVVIGLVDEKSPQANYSSISPHCLISIREVGIPNLEWMISHYNIVELNTAAKPFYFDYLFREYNAEHILYFDPDIFVYEKLESLTDHFFESDVLLTPHVVKPIPFGVYPWENHFLKHGIYNLGFIGLKNTVNTNALLTWWKDRCAEHCLADFRKGLYVDQLWANFIPLFFSKVHIEKNEGCNVAFWNLHEKELGKERNKYTVNGLPLIFFHFSSFDPNKPESLAKENYSNYDYKNNPYLLELLSQYRDSLIKNNYASSSRIQFAFTDKSISKKLEEISKTIDRREKLLNTMSFFGIKKEAVIYFMFKLFKDYLRYNNLLITNRNDGGYNNFDNAFKIQRNRERSASNGVLSSKLRALTMAFRFAFGKHKTP